MSERFPVERISKRECPAERTHRAKGRAHSIYCCQDAVITKRAIPTVDDAQAIVRQLVRAHPSIEGVIVFGSVARGDADEWSDVDLVVIGSDPEMTAQQLRSALTGHEDRLSFIYYTASTLRNLCHERALFVSHIQREGIVLYD